MRWIFKIFVMPTDYHFVGEKEPLLVNHDENEPLLKRKIEDVGNNSPLFTLFLLLKSFVGAGIMSMPFAFLK